MSLLINRWEWLHDILVTVRVFKYPQRSDLNVAVSSTVERLDSPKFSNVSDFFSRVKEYNSSHLQGE